MKKRTAAHAAVTVLLEGLAAPARPAPVYTCDNAPEPTSRAILPVVLRESDSV